LLCKVTVQSKFGTRVHVKRLASQVAARISDLLRGENKVLGLYCNNTLLSGVNNVNFLGLQLDNNINWKNHIHKTVTKLRSACFLIRRMHPTFIINTLKMIYFAYFHSVMEFSISFWGVSVDSKKVFLQQKKSSQNYDRVPP
jgi:hypothetical protein